MNYRILLVDDDKDLCVLMRKYLLDEGYLVDVCHDGESAVQKASDDSYQLLILDVMLPKRSGFDVLTQIRKESNIPILMLTAKDSEVDKVSGLRMGADDYLTKPFNTSEFLARAASLLRRYTVFNSAESNHADILEIGEMRIEGSRHEVSIGGNLIELTAKEFALLYFLANHRGQVFTKKQIYRGVWEEEYAFDDNNIMVHIRRLRKKIEPDPENPMYILTVWGVGYKFGGEG
jgi:DNA-binding response OmpR family regulator